LFYSLVPRGTVPIILTNYVSRGTCGKYSQKIIFVKILLLMKSFLIITASLLLSTTLFSQNKKQADLIVLAQKVYTVTRGFDVTDGLVIDDGKIVFAGTKETILEYYTAHKTIDVPDAYVFPGFIDAHCHFSGYALDAYKCTLTGTTSYEEVINKLVAYEKTNTLGWIYGRGWDQNDWAVKEYPHKAALDKLFPDKPVILKRIDGHAVLCNQKALDMAGITTNTVIDGGIIEKKNGALTGILIDNATEPVEKLLPMLPEEEAIAYLKKAEQTCFSEGLTGVVDCGVTTPVIQLLESLYRKNILSIGNNILLSQDESTIRHYLKKGPYSIGQFRVNGIKVYADGALGSRGACLLADYSDRPGHRGMLLSSYTTLNSFAEKAKRFGWQLCTHAIGDSANRSILDIYGFHLKTKNDLRWRIEHAQVVDRQDYVRFSTYSIVPSVQPTHAISDMPWAETRLGPARIDEAYAYNDLLKQNGWIALGTDFPVEEISPLATFYTAVVRKDKNGQPANGFLKNNALSRMDALKGMTIWAAKSVFSEGQKGSLEPGKDADIIILDTDIITAPEKDLPKAKVLTTIVKGTVVFSN
jgi:predicted amidohydrolase YtcJ